MKKFFLLFLLLGNLIFANRWQLARQEMKIPARLDLVKILIKDNRQLQTLEQWGVIINQIRDGYCLAEISPTLFEKLAKKGYQFEILSENISNLYYENFFAESERGRYLTYTEFVDTMHVIAINNPLICKLETLGLSHQNRLILALKISDSAAIDEMEPAIYFDGNIHGDEKIGWAVCFEFIKYLLNNYNFNPTVSYLVDNREIWIVPMINPDGYVNNVRYNGRSVDLNRNFGWMWGNESNCGASAFSENEATFYYDLYRKQPFVIYTTYHAGDSVISNPWSYTTYDSIPEKFVVWYLSAGYSQRGNNYPYGQGSIIMYTINGSSKDYCYGFAGEVSWSIELHNIKTPPASAIDPTFNINKDAMLWLCHKAGHGIRGRVYDSLTGQPLHAQIWMYPRNYLSYSSPVNGDFHRFYLPGMYNVIVQCAGYKPETSLVIIPTSTDSTAVVNFAMLPDSNAVSNFAMQVISCLYVTTSTNRTYPVRALGVRDSVAYQLDNNKWIVLEMAKPIRNDSGFDFTVFRSQGNGTATVKVSNNWKGPWTTIGTANASRTHFDLATVGFDSAKYVRLDGVGTFYLDAIEKYKPTSGLLEHNQNVISQDFSLQLQNNIVQTYLKLNYPTLTNQELILSVYDINGMKVNKIVLPQASNSFTYDLKTNQNKELANGVYFIKVDGMNLPAVRFIVIR
ncbi:MAG: M14 family zinc carboxypeptidase [candidate division WOR-3 bacterium]